MAPYTDDDINKGAGAFEQAMRSQTEIPGRGEKMSASVAIGIISAAIRAKLPAKLINEVLDQHFAADARVLKNVLQMYEGNDWRSDLWHLQPSGTYKLCTDLCRSSERGWRYDRGLASTDW